MVDQTLCPAIYQAGDLIESLLVFDHVWVFDAAVRDDSQLVELIIVAAKYDSVLKFDHCLLMVGLCFHLSLCEQRL